MEDNELSSNILIANTYAVIIGIGRYKDPVIPDLKYTHEDAKDLYDILADPKKVGIQKENIKLLLDENATLQNIKSTIGTWLLYQADKDSLVIIFFSGHGGVEPDALGMPAKYLLPWDASRDDLFATAISSRDFEGLLKRIKSNRLVMFLDACHSGGVISREGTKDVTIENLCADLALGSGRAIIAASQGSQQSFEDDQLRHGIFAHHLLEALTGKADTDEDGKITLTETFKYLMKEVPKTAWRLAHAVQEPMMRSELTKDITLAFDLDKLNEIKKQEELAARQAKVKEDKGKLLHWWSQHILSTEHYDMVLRVYETDDTLLNDQERKIKELTHELLAGKLAIKQFISSINIILGTTEKPVMPEAVERKIREEEAAERKVSEKSQVEEKAKIKKEKKLVQIEKPASVNIKPIKKRWLWVAITLVLIIGIGLPILLSKLPKEHVSPGATVTTTSTAPTSAPTSVTTTPTSAPIAEACSLTINSQGQGTVVLSPTGGSYSSGTQVTLTATPASGWKFMQWSGGLSGSENPVTMTIKSDTEITASFIELLTKYTLTIDSQGQGTVNMSPAGGSYTSGTQVTLTATPEFGYEFLHWSGALTGSQNPATITLNSDTQITAVFSEMTGTAIITGKILYNNQPIVNYTTAPPVFWIGLQDGGEKLSREPDYDNKTGIYTITHVPAGKYAISVRIDAAAPFDGYPLRPGDFDGGGYDIIVQEGETLIQSDLTMRRLIHLTSPEDNINSVRSIYDIKPSYPAGPLVFTWDSIPEATRYSVTINKIQDSPFTGLGKVWTTETTGTTVSPTLTANEDNQFYQFYINAYNSAGMLVGQFTMLYTNGYGGDYRFTVK